MGAAPTAPIFKREIEMKKLISAILILFPGMSQAQTTVQIDATQWAELNQKIDAINGQLGATDLSGLMYVFIALMAGWAFISGIHILNS